jgi:carbamoyl-phosphate synthase large subunit
MTNFNVLFTSVGRRVELLRCMRAAYKSLGLSGRIVAVDIDPLAPALREADAFYIVPRLDRPDYISKLHAILQREQIAAVFPLIDPDIPVLADHRQVLETGTTRLAVVPSEAAKIVSDKRLTNDFFKRLGLPIARSWMPDELTGDLPPFPLFIKPRFGSASVQTFRLENKEQLEFFAEYVKLPIIQECLAGPEITNDVVCDLEGKVLSVVSRERIRVRSGEVIVGKTVYDPNISENCVKIAEALPAIGPITVQCMMHEGSPRFTEINARFGGGMPAGIAAGADSLVWLLASMAGIPIDVPPLRSYRANMYFSRFEETSYLNEAELEAMASHNI